MEWNLLTAKNLAVIEQKLQQNSFSLAELEIVRRCIFTSADFEYYSRISFLNQPLISGLGALSARIPIIVDSNIIQAGISDLLHRTFLNPVYCLDHTSSSNLPATKSSVWQNLALRYDSAIYVVGDNLLFLSCLLDLIEAQSIQPSLIVATPVSFIGKEAINKRLGKCNVPQIRIDGAKGGVSLAIAILLGLVDLAWIAKHQSLTIES